MINIYKTLLFLELLRASNASSNKFATDYCKFFCDNGSQLTICKRRYDCSPVFNCSFIPLNNTSRKRILDAHNYARDAISRRVMQELVENYRQLPRAGNMKKLVYNKELEFLALCQANLCSEEGDDCRITDEFKDSVGRVVFQSMEPMEDFFIILEKWFKLPSVIEKNQTQMYEEEYENQAKLKDVLQMMNAETRDVGCALSRDNVEGNHFMFCYYGPGLKIGKEVYRAGEPCSLCDDNFSCDGQYDGLCSTGTEIKMS